MQIIVDSLLTSYQDTGDGKTVLLLHGWGDSSKGLQPLTNSLSRVYRVVVLDLPGFGGTQTPEEVWGVSEYAAFVSAFVAKLKLRTDVVIGHSNGGAIAIRALAHNLKAKQLVLVASAGIRGEYKGRKKAMRLIAKAGKALTRPLPGRMKKQLRRKVYTTIGSDMLVAEHLQETFKRVVEDDVRDDAAKVTIPTLLIYGDKDVSTPPRFGRMFHAVMPNSKLTLIPNGEHMLPADNTAELTKLIEEYVG